MCLCVPVCVPLTNYCAIAIAMCQRNLSRSIGFLIGSLPRYTTATQTIREIHIRLIYSPMEM